MNTTVDKNLQSKFLSLYAMVLADGIVQVKELETLYRIGKECYNLSEEEIGKYVFSAGTSFVVPEGFSEKVELLYHMAEIAWADGKIDETEKHLLSRYAARLGFMDENSDEIAEWLLEQVCNGISLKGVLKSIEQSTE